MKISISAEYVWRIAPFVSTEETRFYLNGFAVVPCETGTLIVATDGSTLGMFYDESALLDEEARNADPTIWRLPKNMIALCKPKRRGTDEARMDLTASGSESTAAYVNGSTTTATDVKVDATYPNFRQVIPEMPEDRKGFATYSGKLLKTFDRAGDNGNPLTICTGDTESAALVFSNRSDFLGVIMPMRNKREIKVPGWFVPATPTPAVKQAA